MKRWMLLALVLIVIAASLLLVRLRLAGPTPVSRDHLVRTPHSAYRYNLCVEAFAYSHAQADNPFKTDYSFRDPFRQANDTIIPRLMDLDKSDNTVTFDVEIIVGQLQCCRTNRINSSFPTCRSSLLVRLTAEDCWRCLILPAPINGYGRRRSMLSMLI